MMLLWLQTHAQGFQMLKAELSADDDTAKAKSWLLNRAANWEQTKCFNAGSARDNEQKVKVTPQLHDTERLQSVKSESREFEQQWNLIALREFLLNV